jgi:hypothetical protein
MSRPSAALAAILAAASAEAQDWPTLRGSADRGGRVEEAPPAGKPLRIWVRHFAGERMGSGMEPIVAESKVFVATHSGNLYALEAETGKPLWRFEGAGAFLHSPAYGRVSVVEDGKAVAKGRVVAASANGLVHAVDALEGGSIWTVKGDRGFAASPAIADGVVYVGSRGGEFLAIDLASGRPAWRADLGAPVRQTAGVSAGRVFVTAEDLRVWCLDAKTGRIVWTSAQLQGQSARDYYPVVATAGGRTFVVVRTNPVIHHPDRLSRDLQLICRNAGIESHWQKIDAWTKGDQVRGNAELWEKEQAAIVKHLEERPETRSFFALDAATGKEAGVAPILWVGGCQGVPPPPVVLPDGRLQVFTRTAYTNWTLGVAPLVGLGALDLVKNRIEPWFHESGRQPPWNTFWGTADEAQNFLLAGSALLVVHQSTLSSLELGTKRLSGLAGDRDGWGGFRNLPWAGNEWNGPARGGVALAGKRLFWLTGSRVHAYEFGAQGKPAPDVEIEGITVPARRAPPAPIPDLKARLAEAVGEAVRGRWAPLYTQQGIAGREFFFEESGEVFEALARAHPHLPAELQEGVRKHLAEEWKAHPPFAKEAWLPLGEGARRELFPVPAGVLSRAPHEKPHHPFGGVHAAWLYAELLGEWPRIQEAWPAIRAAFEDWLRTGWRLDPEKGHLLANRYLSSLLAYQKIARRMDDAEAAKVHGVIGEAAKLHVAWWRRAAERSRLRVYRNIAELDEFITRGEEGLFFKIIPHNHKVALFHDLTPEVAAIVRGEAWDAAEKLWKDFETLCATWSLAGEERQVHFGENFADPPDFARDAYTAMLWFGRPVPEQAALRTDIPYCRADLAYIRKLALALERAK